MAGVGAFLVRSFLARLAQRIRPIDGDLADEPGENFDNNPAADTVVEQGEPLYDAAGNRVQSTAWQRFHDATGTGPLGSPGSAGILPAARRTYDCWWQDAVGREIAAADYGTKGGAALVRPEVPPAGSETVLVTRTVHASTGEPGAVIAPDGTVTRWKRDAIGRETETIENFKEGAAPAADVNRTTRFTYHPNGGLETLTLVNDVTGDKTTRWIYLYDELYQVIRDAVGTLNTNRSSIGGIPGEEEGFTYDPTGKCPSASRNDLRIRFADFMPLNAAKQWLVYRKDANGTPVLDQTRSNNRDNQLTQYRRGIGGGIDEPSGSPEGSESQAGDGDQIDGSSQGIEYDRAGNAVKTRPGVDGDWSKHFELVWDAWNRLVEVKDENGVTVQKNAYDGLTRRITKESGGEVVHTYWSDRWKPLEERIDSATTAAGSYLWGERPGHRDELVLRDRDTNGDGTLDERLYATMDYFNGTAIMDASGAVLERYGYSAFGPRRVMAPNFSPKSVSDFDSDFGFQGQFRDEETGWYNYGFRYYVPLLGRWINRDPIAERGGANLYVFVENGPTGKSDVLGLSSCGPKTLRHYRTSNENIKIETDGGEIPVNPLKMLEKFHEEVAKGGAREQARKKPWMEQAMEMFDEMKDAADGAMKRMQLNSSVGVIISVTVEFDVECCTCDSSGNYFWKAGDPVSETEELGAEMPPYPNLPTAVAKALKAAGEAAKMQCSTKK